MKKSHFGLFVAAAIIGVSSFLFSLQYAHASIVINTNVSSVKAQHALEKSQALLPERARL